MFISRLRPKQDKEMETHAHIEESGQDLTGGQSPVIMRVGGATTFQTPVPVSDPWHELTETDPWLLSFRP